MQAHQALFDHCLEVIFSKKKSNQSLSLKEALTASAAEVAETCRDDGDIYRAHTIFLAAVESVCILLSMQMYMNQVFLYWQPYLASLERFV